MIVNGALSVGEKFTPIFDDQPVLTPEGEMQAGGAKGTQLFVLDPG